MNKIQLLNNKVYLNYGLLLFLFILILSFVLNVFSVDIEWNFDLIPYKIYPLVMYLTLKISFFSWLIGMVFGVPVGLSRAKNIPILNELSSIIFYTIKGIPAVIHIFFLYAVIRYLELFSPYVAAIVALGICGSYKVSEIIGLYFSSNTNKKIKLDLLTIKELAVFSCYVFVYLIKESSILYFIGAKELFTFNNFVALNATGFEVIFITAFAYFFMVFSLTQVLKIIRKRVVKNDTLLNNPKAVCIL